MKSKALGVSPLHYPETPVILASPRSFMQSLASILCTFWSLVTILALVRLCHTPEFNSAIKQGSFPLTIFP